MTGLKVLLDQPRDSFSAGTFVNMIPFGNDTVLPFIQVDCRGWDIFENRARNLREAAACESLQASQGYHNSWLTLHEDKKNKYDPNAIELLVRGEAFGNAGYIAKEQTEAVRKLAELCSCKVGDLHVTIARKDFDHLKNVPLVVYGHLIVKDELVNFRQLGVV